jgi:phosphopantetheinyl transferase
MTHVLVLHARLTAGPVPQVLDQLLERLPYAKRLELERRDLPARHASLAGIDLALRGLAALRDGAVDANELRFPADGKPHLAAGPSFSMSHGHRTVGVALSAGGEVGFDLEDIDELPDGSAATRVRLLRWTATEAVLKAAGRGLSDIGTVDLEPSLRSGRIGGSLYYLESVPIGDDAVAHVATAVPVTSVSVREVVCSVAATGG